MATATKTRRRTKKQQTGWPSDPATRYARAVVEQDPTLVEPDVRKLVESTAEPGSGLAERKIAQICAWSIVQGRAVRLACQRHLDDIKRQKTEAFPYYWSEKAASHIVSFFPRFLTLENGAPFHLPPWLQFVYGSIHGWKVWNGRSGEKFNGKLLVELPDDHVERAGCRRFLHSFIETSKGSGKTPSAGGFGLFGLAFDKEQSAEIYTAGFDRDQASIILNDAIRMARASATLTDMLIVDKYNIAHPASNSFFRAMSSEHRSKSGPRPQFVLSDEIHEYRDGTVVIKAEAGFKSRNQPHGLKLTNSGADRTSYCWQLHEKSINVLQGTHPDEQWFAYVCHLDPCDEHYAEGYRQPKDGCSKCDDWTNPAVWPKVAPALGIVIKPKYLQDAIDTATTIASEYNMKRRLNFCIWTKTHNVWIPTERWDACRVEKVSENNDVRVAAAAGLDPSSTIDFTSLCVALRFDDPPSDEKPEEVEIDGMDEAGNQIKLAFKLNFHVEVIPYFWIPEETMQARIQKERIPYDAWARMNPPHIFSTPGPAIDHDAVYKFTLDIWKRYKLQRLGMDENHGRYLFMKLQNEGKLGKQVISVGQGKKLSEAFKFIEILIAHRRLRHAGNLALAECIANSEPHTDRVGAKWIEKPGGDETKHIDGAVAMAMAIHQLMTLPVRKKSIGAFIV